VQSSILSYMAYIYLDLTKIVCVRPEDSKTFFFYKYFFAIFFKWYKLTSVWTRNATKLFNNILTSIFFNLIFFVRLACQLCKKLQCVCVCACVYAWVCVQKAKNVSNRYKIHFKKAENAQQVPENRTKREY